jgi:hypothetical protein
LKRGALARPQVRAHTRFVMTTRHLIRTVMTIVVVALCCWVLVDPVLAQCVMCRASLSGNSSFVRNLNIGVFVLLIPPVSIFCTVFFLAFRHRK